MSASTIDTKAIDQLREFPDLLPVRRDNFEDWPIRVVNREHQVCRNYLSANRRGFYKIVFLNEGAGEFTLGMHTYHIKEPSILFIHPNEIISWINLAREARSTGHFCIFKQQYLDEHPALISIIKKYAVFTDSAKSVIQLPGDAVESINQLFLKMHDEQAAPSPLVNDALQAYIQLIIVGSSKVALKVKPDVVNDEYRHICSFFQLLEKETSGINYSVPLRIKTAKEFADQLAVHPNHLNALLKKHTGQNLSLHIKTKLLEESKVLLLQTNWTLQNIGYAIGFAEQPNFSQFFKKYSGLTPVQFRKSYGL